MTIKTPQQSDMFALPTEEVLTYLTSPQGKSNIILIGCGERKRRGTHEAAELYTSQRFKNSVVIAKNLGAQFYIISGLHGLVDPHYKIDSYELDLSKQSEHYQSKWGREIIEKLRKFGDQQITILADKNYTKTLLAANAELDYQLKLTSPFQKMQDYNHTLWLDQAKHLSHRLRDMKLFYAVISEAKRINKVFSFDSLKNQTLDEKGVYVIIDTSETNFFGDKHRVVRIGTHAVSAGSKATLRSRLRNHLGKSDGAGNHRGSIFRLHVGRALLEFSKENHNFPTWGIGQNAERSIIEKEIDWEIRVSQYLSKLEVFVIPISDEASKNSLRAHIETQLIALFSEGFVTIDQPSPRWLGKHSPTNTIIRSGLWNIRDVGKTYDPNGAGSVEQILKITGMVNNE